MLQWMFNLMKYGYQICNLFIERKPNITELSQARQTRQYNILQKYAWMSAMIVHYSFTIWLDFTVTSAKFAKLLGMSDTLLRLYTPDTTGKDLFLDFT